MKRNVIMVAACLAVWMASSLTRADVPCGVNLSKLEGWNIVIAQGAIASERYAAEEFQQHVASATGHTLAIVNESDRRDRLVFIGTSDLMRQSEAGFSVDGFGPEDLRIVVRNDVIIIAGELPDEPVSAVAASDIDFAGSVEVAYPETARYPRTRTSTSVRTPMSSRVMPLAKNAWAESPVWLSKGRTAIRSMARVVAPSMPMTTSLTGS